MVNELKIKLIILIVLFTMLFAVASCERSGESLMGSETSSSLETESKVPAPESGTNHAELIIKAVNDSKGKTIAFSDRKYVIDKDIVINKDVKLSNHTFIEVTDKGSFTVNGNLFAAKRQVFYGQGNIRLNMPDSWGYIEWFEGTVAEYKLDCTELFQKSFDSLSRVAITNKTYSIGGITINRPIEVKGIGTHRIKIAAASDCKKMFNVKSGEVSFNNFLFEMISTEPDSVCFYMDTDSCDIKGFRLTDCYINGAYTAITDADGVHSVTDVYISGITCQMSRGTQLLIRDFEKNITLIDFAVLRRHTNEISCKMAGVIIENANDMLIEHLDVNGDWTESGNDGHGVIFRNCKNVKMRRVLMEYLCGSGFIIDNCSGFDWENVQTYTFSNMGFYINGLKDSKIDIVKVTYNIGNGDEWFDKENYVIKNCSNVIFNSVISNGSRGSGMVISGSTDVTVNSYLYCERLSGNQAYAFKDGGGNTNVLIDGFTDNSNSGKSYNLTGSGVVIRSAWLANGNFVPEISEGKG